MLAIGTSCHFAAPQNLSPKRKGYLTSVRWVIADALAAVAAAASALSIVSNVERQIGQRQEFDISDALTLSDHWGEINLIPHEGHFVDGRIGAISLLQWCRMWKIYMYIKRFKNEVYALVNRPLVLWVVPHTPISQQLLMQASIGNRLITKRFDLAFEMQHAAFDISDHRIIGWATRQSSSNLCFEHLLPLLKNENMIWFRHDIPRMHA
jgi:hypothetical protein